LADHPGAGVAVVPRPTREGGKEKNRPAADPSSRELRAFDEKRQPPTSSPRPVEGGGKEKEKNIENVYLSPSKKKSLLILTTARGGGGGKKRGKTRVFYFIVSHDTWG